LSKIYHSLIPDFTLGTSAMVTLGDLVFKIGITKLLLCETTKCT